MTINERVAYLKGVAAGLAIEEREDGELFKSIIETLSEIADELESLSENALDIGEELDTLSDDLADVEEYLFDDEFEDDDDFDFDSFDIDEDDEDFHGDVCGCTFCGSADAAFSIDITCPECEVELELDNDDILNESVICPSCNCRIDLEIDEVDFDDDFGDTDTASDEEDLATLDGATQEEVYPSDENVNQN